jgi:hypothetical protein
MPGETGTVRHPTATYQSRTLRVYWRFESVRGRQLHLEVLATIDSDREGEPPVRVVEMPDRLPETCFGEDETGKSRLAVSVAVSVAATGSTSPHRPPV